MIKITLLIIPLLFSGVSIVLAEDYFYIPNHKLETPPVFCAMEFEDTQLPDAKPQLLQITKNAILDWETKLVEATNITEGWDFKFRTISIQEQQELYFDAYCTVNIYFERQPPEGQWDYLGYAESYLTFSDIRIFYLEPIYEFNGKLVEINGESWEEAEVTGFRNLLTYGLQDTIRHEIGHSLGLDHPILESSQFVRGPSGALLSPSIMIDELEYEITGEIRYKITDYDVRSLTNLYGKDGINEFNFMVYLDFIIIGIGLVLLVFFVNRKFRVKESRQISSGMDDETSRCVRCNGPMFGKNEHGLCNSCQLGTKY